MELDDVDPDHDDADFNEAREENGRVIKKCEVRSSIATVPLENRGARNEATANPPLRLATLVTFSSLTPFYTNTSSFARRCHFLVAGATQHNC